MPGFFPGRPGGERDEPLLDMLLERRPIPPGAPPEVHGLARMLAAAAGSAEPGELAGEDAALAAFSRLVSPVGTSPAAPRSARRSLRERSARGRLLLAAALTVAAAGLGSTAAAYAGVLPGPIQQFAHVAIGAPGPSRDSSQHSPAVATSSAGAHHKHGSSGPLPTHAVTSPVPTPGDAIHRKWPYGSPGHRPWPAFGGCLPTPSPTRSPVRSSPSLAPVNPGPTQNPASTSPIHNPASPGPGMPGWAVLSPAATACPGGPTQSEALRTGR